MASDEIVDSGRFSGGRSNFSQMCTLLSQYLKEKGSFGDIKLRFTQSFEPEGSPAETMNLLPMIEKSGLVSDSGSGNLNVPPTSFPQQAAAGSDETQKKSDPSAQMTIFYAGRIIVFDDFPADKANEIMMLASKSSAAQAQKPPNAAFPPLYAAQSPAESTTGVPTLVIQDPRLHHSAEPPLGSDLPMARKNSLARFLEKRKERITTTAPYPASKPTGAPKPEAWLGLAHELPLRVQHY